MSNNHPAPFGQLVSNSVQVPGTTCVNHVIRNTHNEREVSIVQHVGGWFNVRNDSDVEVYDGEYSESLIDTLLKMLFGD